MRTRTVEYQDDTLKIKLIVAAANVYAGMRRSLLQAEADEAEADVALRILRRVTYPDMMAATIEAEGFESWPLPFEDFIELPDGVLYPWESAVYDLNPHWLGLQAQTGEEAEEEVKKKATNSIADSPKK